MAKLIYWLLAIAAIVFGVWFFVERAQAPSTQTEISVGQKDTEAAPVVMEVRPWVEVLSDKVRLKTKDGWNDLRTGDELPNGAVISTDEKGLADIHMPDGSSIQLDANSEITLEQADYMESADSIKVKVRLAFGRVWSKIIELATTDSYWEVRSNNAVAAVRGTAFWMEYYEGDTQVMGSENTVEVQAMDPENGLALEGASAKVIPNKILAIRKDAISKLREKRLNLSEELKDADAALLERPFIKRAILRDRIINQKIEKWKEAGMNRIEIRQSIRRELTENRQRLLKAVIERLKSVNREVVVPVRSVNPALEENLVAPVGDNNSGAAVNLNVVSPAVIGAGAPTDTVENDIETPIEEGESASSGTSNLGPYFLNQANPTSL